MQATVTTHKEEGPSRIQTDAIDMEKIRDKLTTCIDPLYPDSHKPGTLLDIVTGRVTSPTVNVVESVKLGKILMKRDENGWPESFLKPLVKPTTSMTEHKKKAKIMYLNMTQV